MILVEKVAMNTVFHDTRRKRVYEPMILLASDSMKPGI